MLAPDLGGYVTTCNQSSFSKQEREPWQRGWILFSYPKLFCLSYYETICIIQVKKKMNKITMIIIIIIIIIIVIIILIITTVLS